jgi:hypothetical protein
MQNCASAGFSWEHRAQRITHRSYTIAGADTTAFAEEGKDRALWLVVGVTPASAGVFRPLSGQPTILPISAEFTRYRAVAISVESGPRGAATPTAVSILIATLPETR